MIYLMAPMGVLLAVLITFGLLDKSSELTAMKATGFSIYRATLPVIVLSGMFAAGLFVFDQLYIPHTNREQEILRNESRASRRRRICRPIANGSSGRTTDLLLPRLRSRPEQFRRHLGLRVRPQQLPVDASLQAEACVLGPAPAEVGVREGMGARPERRVDPGLQTFDVTTLRPELREDPGYFKKEVKQSSEMNYDELRAYIDDLQQSGFDTCA